MNKAKPAVKKTVRSKPVKKSAATVSAAKPVKKASLTVSSSKPAKKRSAAVKVKSIAPPELRSLSQDELAVVFAGSTDKPKRKPPIPLAEAEALAATAVRRLKASRKLAAAKKVRRLEMVAWLIEHARERGAMSYPNALSLKHIHEPPTMRACDIRRACKI